MHIRTKTQYGQIDGSISVIEGRSNSNSPFLDFAYIRINLVYVCNAGDVGYNEKKTTSEYIEKQIVSNLILKVKQNKNKNLLLKL